MPVRGSGGGRVSGRATFVALSLIVAAFWSLCGAIVWAVAR